MNQEEIHEEWQTDAVLHPAKLDEEILKVDSLVAKYLRFWTHTKRELRELEKENAILRIEKREFLVEGETAETRKRGWVWRKGRPKIIKSEVEMYLGYETDIQEMNIKIKEKEDCIKLITDILDNLKWRKKGIQSMFEIRKFLNGA